MLGTPAGYQQLTGLSSVKTCTVPSGAYAALIACETQNVRWLDTGSDPTASSGMLMKTTDPPLVYRGDLADLRFIEATAGAKVNILYYLP